jgi:pimeloyl-ACP methyl ester carboxylesterase
VRSPGLAGLAEQTIEVGSLQWFYREATPTTASDRLPVVLLHGLLAQSWSWKNIMPALADQGMRAIAPDWIGHGFSSKADARSFAYTSSAFATVLGEFLDALGLSEIVLVAQGYLGAAGIRYALDHPERVKRLAILNAPIVVEARWPWKIQQLGLPIVGDMLVQDPLVVDRTLEGGGGYQVEEEDLKIFRKPFLTTSAAGRSIKSIVQQLQPAQLGTELAQDLCQWPNPLLLAWGDRDPWLPWHQVEPLLASLKAKDVALLEEVGHYPQLDWPEKVLDALQPFLR